MTTWADARTVQSSDDVRAALLAACVTQGCTVNGWSPDAPQRAMLEGNASALSFEQGIRAQLAGTASVDTLALLDPDWVDAIMTFFDLDNGTGGKGRILASSAVWDVPLQVSAFAAPITIDIMSGIQVQSSNGTIFQSTPLGPVVLNSDSSFIGTVRFTARVPGTSGNVTAGQITKVISGPAGLSIYGSGTQVLVTAARDDETNAQFIKRGLGKWATKGAGWSRTSFDFLIPEFAPTVTDWRVRDDNPFGPGTIQVILRNAAGPSSPDENSAVLAGLTDSARQSLGIGGLRVVSASSNIVSVASTLFGDGTNASLLANAKSALDALARTLPIGGDVDGYLRGALLIEILMGGANLTYGLTGFRGAKNLDPKPSDTIFAIDDVLVFDYSGLVLG